MVPQADAGSEPGTVMVHLKHASPTGGAVMRSIRFPSLALFAEAQLPIALDSERGSDRSGLGREQTVAIVVGRRTGTGKDGRGVRPVEKDVDETT